MAARFVAGSFGLRAFCSIPRGVEEAVMGAVAWGSDMDRREGNRGIFGGSADGIFAGASSSVCGDVGDRGLAKSMASPGTLAALSGGVAMVDSRISPLWHGRQIIARSCNRDSQGWEENDRSEEPFEHQMPQDPVNF